MRKKSIFLLILLIGILTLGTQVQANEFEKVSTVLSCSEENPLYENENIQIPIAKKSTKLKASAKAATVNSEGTQTTTEFEPSEYIENKATISKKIRNNMMNRIATFTIKIKVTFDHELQAGDTSYDKYIAELIQSAMSEELATTSSTGDYLRWSWRDYNVGVAENEDAMVGSSGGKYTYYIPAEFKFLYYTTIDQEQTLDKDVKNFVAQNIDKTNDTDIQKVFKVHTYICSNVAYDYENKEDATYTLKYSAYAAMENKTAVCQGYATLYYKMLKEAGFSNVRVVASEGHGWNIVKLGAMYYHVDATWDSDQNQYIYFLRGNNFFNKYDENDNHKRTQEYNSSTFNKKYSIDKEDYNIENPRIDLSRCVMKQSVTTCTYANKNITPTITATYCDYQLVKGKDFNVTYTDNKVSGIATITITGINNFEGKVSKTFKILPAKTTGVKASKNATNSLRLSWTKQAGVTGYRVYKYNTKTKKYDYVSGSQTSNTYVDIKKLSTGTAYSFKVRAYKTTNQGELFGDYSAVVTTATTPSKVTIKAPTAGKKKLTAKWKKVSPATGYVVEYSTNNKFKASATKKVTVTKNSTLSKTIKNLKKKKKYYVRIRAYKEVNKTKYYGTYSSVKSIKTK